MKVLICNPGVPHPSLGASSVLFYNYIEAVTAAGYEILDVLLIEGNSATDDDVGRYRSGLEAIGTFDVLPCYSQQFVEESAFGIRLQTSELTSVLTQALNFRPDIILSFDILSAWVMRDVMSPRRLSWLGDLNFQTHWYRARYGLAEGLIKAKDAAWVFPLVAVRCLQWKKIYRDVLQDHDRVIVSSKSSEEHLAKLGIAATYHPYPWPSKESRPDHEVQSDKPTFVFFGNLEGLGSRSALHFMIDELYPRSLQRWGRDGFLIKLAGTGELPAWASEALVGKPEFRTLGFVADLDELLQSCHAMLAPIAIPVGNRSRIVTAMAKGCLVIAHRNAALGNPDLVHDQTCLLASDAKAFVEAMDRAASSDPAISTLVAAAQARYLECFHPDRATNRLIALLNEVAST